MLDRVRGTLPYVLHAQDVCVEHGIHVSLRLNAAARRCGYRSLSKQHDARTCRRTPYALHMARTVASIRELQCLLSQSKVS